MAKKKAALEPPKDEPFGEVISATKSVISDDIEVEDASAFDKTISVDRSIAISDNRTPATPTLSDNKAA